jgi:hypothetical protein
MEQTNPFQPKTSGMSVTLTFLQLDFSPVSYLLSAYIPCLRFTMNYVRPDKTTKTSLLQVKPKKFDR